MANRTLLVGPDTYQMPFVEYYTKCTFPHWRIWQSFNADVSSGTYLHLYPDGAIDRVTSLNGMATDITRICGPAT